MSFVRIIMVLGFSYTHTFKYPVDLVTKAYREIHEHQNNVSIKEERSTDEGEWHDWFILVSLFWYVNFFTKAIWYLLIFGCFKGKKISWHLMSENTKYVHFKTCLKFLDLEIWDQQTCLSRQDLSQSLTGIRITRSTSDIPAFLVLYAFLVLKPLNG